MLKQDAKNICYFKDSNITQNTKCVLTVTLKVLIVTFPFKVLIWPKMFRPDCHINIFHHLIDALKSLIFRRFWRFILFDLAVALNFDQVEYIYSQVIPSWLGILLALNSVNNFAKYFLRTKGDIKAWGWLWENYLFCVHRVAYNCLTAF